MHLECSKCFHRRHISKLSRVAPTPRLSHFVFTFEMCVLACFRRSPDHFWTSLLINSKKTLGVLGVHLEYSKCFYRKHISKSLAFLQNHMCANSKPMAHHSRYVFLNAVSNAFESMVPLQGLMRRGGSLHRPDQATCQGSHFKLRNACSNCKTSKV